MQLLDPSRTSWHITFGTYGTRLHGSRRPTIDKKHNELGTPFLPENRTQESQARQWMTYPPRLLNQQERLFVEQQLPQICDRGGWSYRIAAVSSDHVHLLCDIVPEIHGEKVRRLVKRWLGQALSDSWPLPNGARWWTVEGSNKAVRDQRYLNNVFHYLRRQRTTPAIK